MELVRKYEIGTQNIQLVLSEHWKLEYGFLDIVFCHLNGTKKRDSQNLTQNVFGWTGAKGAREIFLSFFSTMAKKMFLWIYTFQAILRPFHPFNFFSKFRNV
jgi:hypothetical protein